MLGSKIFCIGGYAAGAVSDAMDVFDTTEGKWAQAPAMPVKRALHAAAAYNTKVYVFGGSADTPNGHLSRTTGAEDSMFAFDTVSNKWSSSYPKMYACRGLPLRVFLPCFVFFWKCSRLCGGGVSGWLRLVACLMVVVWMCLSQCFAKRCRQSVHRHPFSRTLSSLLSRASADVATL